MQPQIISISDFSYDLPEEKIAKFPLTQRDSSRLLVYQNGKPGEDVFRNIPGYLEEGSLLVFNNSKVIPARIAFQKESGARIEVFLLEPIHPSEYQQVFQHSSPVSWKCLIGNLKRWKTGFLNKKVILNGSEVTLQTRIIENHGSWQNIEFSWDNQHVNFIDLIDAAGSTPIPPYLNRQATNDDRKWYQTVYSRSEGSVAAPTAGLHFTNELLDQLRHKEINLQEITLHVGAGTFQPVKTSNMAEHPMHTEHFEVGRDLLKTLLKNDKPITAVGTTTVRTLESIYLIGCKAFSGELISDVNIHVDQWEGYSRFDMSREQAVSGLLEWMGKAGIQKLSASTSMMIVPGYRFRMTDRMITNFHQPRSTLLLLIAAFIGNGWRDVYKYALENDFRFLSYGDSSLLIP